MDFSLLWSKSRHRSMMKTSACTRGDQWPLEGEASAQHCPHISAPGASHPLSRAKSNDTRFWHAAKTAHLPTWDGYAWSRGCLPLCLECFSWSSPLLTNSRKRMAFFCCRDTVVGKKFWLTFPLLFCSFFLYIWERGTQLITALVN